MFKETFRIIRNSSLIVASTLAFGSGTDLSGHVQSKLVESNESASSNRCSIDVDCKNPTEPYCNIVYSVDGNYGVCGSVDIPEPLQVLGDQECPSGTKRQLIYQNEGDEAVCLQNSP